MKYLIMRFPIVFGSLRILNYKERRRLAVVTFIQIMLGMLDLIGVVLLGFLGSLAISGISSKVPGNRVSKVLAFLQLDSVSLQMQVATIGLFAAGILVTKTLVSALLVKRTVRFLAFRSAKISNEIFTKLIRNNLLFIRRRTTQQTIFEITTGVDAITLGIINSLVNFFTDLSMLLVIGIGLSIIDLRVTIVTFTLFSIVATYLYLATSVKARQIGLKQYFNSIKYQELLVESLESFREVFVRGRRKYYVENTSRIKNELAHLNSERTFLPYISKYALEVAVIMILLIISALQFFAYDAVRAAGIISVFLAASTRIAPAVLRLQQNLVQIKSNIGIADPTLKLIQELNGDWKFHEEEGEIDFEHKGFKPSIELNSVHFKYEGKEEYALENVSLKVTSGQVIAIVGPSGAGKSTLADIILGVIEPQIGTVTLSEMEPAAAISKWQGAVGYVPQSSHLQNATLIENVGMGYSKESINSNRALHSLEIAQLNNFVKNIDEGLDYQIGEKGNKLSGGQKQRLGIARALFTNPKLLVLDEATSSLDAKTEADLTESINKMRRENLTIIIIAHRLSTIREADSIVYLEKGRIIDIGDFETLRNRLPEFDRLATLSGM